MNGIGGGACSSAATRLLVCPNAFKGSLTAVHAAEAIREGARIVNGEIARSQGEPPWEVELLPLADGGDGTARTLVEATGGSLEPCDVHDPLGRPRRAFWGRLGGALDGTAVIEMAEASGARLLRPDELDPLGASTFGTGELMLAAVEAGCSRLIVGIGGSATTDGGAGMASALGARLLDANGRRLRPGGGDLERIADIDLSGFRLPPDVEVLAACDVDNPLIGPEGAARVYGPQKGATPPQVERLDRALERYAEVLATALGKDVVGLPGSGAAGGLGAGLLAFCSARLERGTELVMDVSGFDEFVRRCDLVITGEGRLDSQTSRGKVIAGVARRSRAAGVPVVALVGSIEAGSEDALRAEGVQAALSIVDGPRRLEEVMNDAYAMLAATSARLLRLLGIRFGARRIS